jgi:glycosyltransferase involved in cell wall biosynthesis
LRKKSPVYGKSKTAKINFWQTDMKICIYSPYFSVPHKGGGERHVLGVALVLAAQAHQVSVAVAPLPCEEEAELIARLPKIKRELEKFLGVSLAPLKFVCSPLTSDHNFLTKFWWTGQFDYVYYVTDGSLFFSMAKWNNLHIQVPLKLDKSHWFERLKLRSWQVKNCNSEFTKSVVEKSWNTKIDFVHYPVVDKELLVNGYRSPKQPIILSVGRFFRQLHSKRQDILIEMFKQLLSEEPDLMSGWKLVLVGSNEDDEYVKELKQAALGLPIEIYSDAPRSKLLELYRKARIFWHAAGFGVDEKTSPERVEHFGIATLEAMAAGAIPIVHGKGGQPEVLGPDLQHLLWKRKADCLRKTVRIINQEGGEWRESQLRKLVNERASEFNQTTFESTIWQMFP